METDKTLEIRLKKLRLEFNRLKQLYHEGKLSQREFVAELKRLRVKDYEGKYWTIGAQSGRWYYFNGLHWVQAEPPVRDEIDQEGLDSELLRENSAFLGRNEPEEVGGISESLLISPEEASLNLISKEIEPRKQKYLLVALPLAPTALFFGGLGLIFGIIAGAIAGSTQFFLDSLSFLPLFLQEIMGKLTGGVILAVGGGLTGFIAGSIAGFLLAFLFNLTSSFTGGLMFKVKVKRLEKE
ncbi:MAG: hypothetical protein N3B16_01335 [Candidatus Aminicenantes bacterium]|nr:hypothetical protein [Candidatus Aminicenantes bacterium]